MGCFAKFKPLTQTACRLSLTQCYVNEESGVQPTVGVHLLSLSHPWHHFNKASDWLLFVLLVQVLAPSASFQRCVQEGHTEVGRRQCTTDADRGNCWKRRPAHLAGGSSTLFCCRFRGALRVSMRRRESLRRKGRYRLIGTSDYAGAQTGRMCQLGA